MSWRPSAPRGLREGPQIGQLCERTLFPALRALSPLTPTLSRQGRGSYNTFPSPLPSPTRGEGAAEPPPPSPARGKGGHILPSFGIYWEAGTYWTVASNSTISAGSTDSHGRWWANRKACGPMSIAS